MKILFAVPRYHPNHDGMVSGLLEAGHEVGMLVREVHPLERHRPGVPVTVLPRASRPPLRFLTGFLRASRPDLVIARNADPVSYRIFLACRLLGVRYLLYVQYPTGYERMGLGRRVRLWLGLWPRHTINSACRSPSDEISGKTFDFVPFAVELIEAKRTYPATLPIRVLTVGKLDQERKNLVPLVRCLAPALREGRVLLSIVGLLGPNPSAAYRSLLGEIAAQGVEAQVKILPNLGYEETRRLYGEHDLFVLASSRERAAISPAEAMAAGLAVICGSDNGATYFVEQGKSGFVFPDRDFAALAERVDQFAANLPALARMGRHGRQVIAERFSPAAYERRLVQVIRDRFDETSP